MPLYCPYWPSQKREERMRVELSGPIWLWGLRLVAAAYIVQAIADHSQIGFILAGWIIFFVASFVKLTGE